MASSYSWTAGSGLWGAAANWADLTTPGAGTAPGSGDIATIAGPAYPSLAFDLLFGPANAATLTATGDVAFAGAANFGSLSATGGADLAILAGASLAAGSAILADVAQISGPGAQLAVAGTLTLAGAALALFDHASLQVQGLTVSAGGYGSIALDATATAEIGGGSLASAGTLAIDAGTTVTYDGQIHAPILDQGTLIANGAVTLYGAVSGTGTLLIQAAQSALTLDGSAGAGLTIGFTGPAEALTLPASIADAVGAGITGFQAGDVLVTRIPAITAAAYTATGANLGTLALSANGSVVETLSLAGNYTGAPFLVLPGAPGSGEALVVLATNSASAPVAAVANPSSDAYSWNVTQGGGWTVAANWTDLTTSSAATAAPGASNSATLTNNGSLVPIVNGNGNAASLTVTGTIALNGTFDAGLLAVGAATGATLDLLAGSVLAAGTADINDTMLVSGSGANFNTSGKLTIGNNIFTAALAATGGALVTAGSLALAAATIATDAASTIEIGTAGGAVAGALNVDAAQIVNDGWSSGIDSALVNNGTVIIGGNATRSANIITGAISGAGTLDIATYGDLALQSTAAAAQSIAFTGTEATLDLSNAGSIAAAITGLAVTDEFVAAPIVTGASFTSSGGNAGTLRLTNAGGSLVAQLAVSGALAGNSFVVLPQPFSGPTLNGSTQRAGLADIVLVSGSLLAGPPPSPAAGSAGGQAFTWGGTGGAWGTAANWGAAAIAPGSQDTVALASGNGLYTIISGAGDAASVTETSGDVLSGAFNFGSLLIQPSATGYGWLDLAAGTTLHAGNATVSAGTLDVVGAGASLVVPGTLTLGNTGSASGTSAVVLADGASAQIAALVLTNNVISVQASDISVDATSALEIGTTGGAGLGLLTVDAGQTVGGTKNLFRIAAAVRNDGTIAATSIYGGIIYGAVSGSGTLAIGAGSTLTVTGAIAASQTIAFGGAGAALVLDAPTSATITGFSAGDVIEYAGTITEASYGATGPGSGTLALGNGGITAATLNLAGTYTGDSFIGFAAGAIAAGGSGLSLVTLAAACFAQGTRLDTPGGPVAIEALRIGDVVRTRGGEAVPIRWLGRRRTDCRRHPRPLDVWPVRVQAHAFGPGCPRRTLFLSPDHAVHITEADGTDALVPIRYLINGASIVQVAVDEVTYWHVELPRHDIVLAEGLASESYLDTGNRAAFDNGGPAIALHPDFARDIWATQACARLVLDGPVLIRTRARLLARALTLGHRLTRDPALILRAGGERLAPRITDDGTLSFALPPGTRVAHLLSRHAVPAHLRTADADHRRLGVAVARIALDGRAVALTDARLGAGWHAAEGDWRWTDGAARLATGGAGRLTLHTLDLLAYWSARPRGRIMAA
ncbi:MAG: Hint domain-containing protein [Rhodospirillales bacterium]|nr:Hint domain-containing protein [Rhodospirillales bacterium]